MPVNGMIQVLQQKVLAFKVKSGNFSYIVIFIQIYPYSLIILKKEKGKTTVLHWLPYSTCFSKLKLPDQLCAVEIM